MGNTTPTQWQFIKLMSLRRRFFPLFENLNQDEIKSLRTCSMRALAFLFLLLHTKKNEPLIVASTLNRNELSYGFDYN